MTAESEHIAKFKCRTVTAEDLPLWVKETLLLTDEAPNSSFKSDLRSVVIEMSPKNRRLKCWWVDGAFLTGMSIEDAPTWVKEKLSKIDDSTDSDDSNSPEDVEMTGEIERINLTL